MTFQVTKKLSQMIFVKTNLILFESLAHAFVKRFKLIKGCALEELIF